MKIAVIDDVQKDRQCIIDHIKKYQLEHELNFDIIEYQNGEDLLEDISKQDIKIIMLDIYMPTSGIDIAKKIRELGYQVAIIFITTSTEHYPQSYEIGSHHYLIKPITYNQISSALNRCQKYLLKTRKYFSINQEHHIYIHDIYYLEVFHNTTTLYTKQGKYKINNPLNKILDLINDEHFIRIHKSYAVHLKHVQQIKDNQIELSNGTILNIGRKYMKDFKTQYWRYLSTQEA